MKHITVKVRMLYIAALTIMLCSCHKSYDCHCDGGALGNGRTETIEGKTKEQAQKECDGYNSNALFGMHNCHLM